ncbi:MAG: glycerophosphodiester phosphodiesterase family protein [Gammaproteobacteria bacterium]|nr:glycerophosphodiester phosphodiesterase family protein [Gammaproteobacteria bacterium]MDH5691547.1 glycerophosphodiester phosphodiesterase family protein [Gammaproteobacteria bacterium]
MTKAKIVAHRGYAAKFPENTIEAFQAAVDLGVSHIELDVQLSADGQPVIVHDDTLQRTAGIDQSVFELNAAELTQIEVGEPERFGNRYKGIRLPLLSDLVTLLEKNPHVTAYVEIKDECIDEFGLEHVVKRVLGTLESVLRQCVIISYNLPCLDLARRMNDCRIGWVLTRYDEESRSLAEQLKPDFLICNYKKVNTVLWPGSWSWFFYEIETPALAHEWIAKGAEYLETMDVEALLLDPSLKGE